MLLLLSPLPSQNAHHERGPQAPSPVSLLCCHLVSSGHLIVWDFFYRVFYKNILVFPNQGWTLFLWTPETPDLVVETNFTESRMQTREGLLEHDKWH